MRKRRASQVRGEVAIWKLGEVRAAQAGMGGVGVVGAVGLYCFDGFFKGDAMGDAAT